MTIAKNDIFSGGYYRSSFNAGGESEGSGSSGRIDAEFTASEDSSIPARKCINLNSGRGVGFRVPSEVIPLSNMSSAERKDLIHRLRLELEQIRILQKKMELHRSTGVAVSSSSDILSCNNGQAALRAGAINKSSGLKSGPVQGKKVKTSGPKGNSLNRGASGRFEPVSAKQVSAPRAANALLMKQCETLLKRLMSHQYGWVFNKPVDVKSLNIPDYYNVIQHPMDLGTIKGKLTKGAYSSPSELAADVRLTFNNAMTYNPPGNDVHIMADTLLKFFEVRWKTIEKKSAETDSQPVGTKIGPQTEVETSKPLPPSKKRKASSTVYEAKSEAKPEPVKPIMSDEERHKLGRQLESLLAELPENIIDFLKEQSANGRESVEEEIEIDIDDLSGDTLFTLKKLLDEYVEGKKKSHARAEPCEMEIVEYGLINTYMQQGKGNDPGGEDVDIGGDEPQVSGCPPVEIENDMVHRNDSEASSSESESGNAKASSPKNDLEKSKVGGSGAQLAEKTSVSNLIDINQSISELDQLEHSSHQRPGSAESDGCQDGESGPGERQASPRKLYRAAVLKNRFADTILKAREKTLNQGEKGDPEKLRREKEELEMQRKKERARIQAEAKAAEDARRRAEAEAQVEARRKREQEREAARQALLRMEKTVEINENSRFLEDLEMLRTIPAEQLPSSVDETSPDHSLDGLGAFKFGGSNPLERLGLFMKADDEEEEAELPTLSNQENDVEEGEID